MMPRYKYIIVQVDQSVELRRKMTTSVVNYKRKGDSRALRARKPRDMFLTTAAHAVRKP